MHFYSKDPNFSKNSTTHSTSVTAVIIFNVTIEAARAKLKRIFEATIGLSCRLCRLLFMTCRLGYGCRRGGFFYIRFSLNFVSYFPTRMQIRRTSNSVLQMLATTAIIVTFHTLLNHPNIHKVLLNATIQIL